MEFSKCRIKNMFSYNKIINVLEVYSKRNIYDYLSRPDIEFDKDYSDAGQKFRQPIYKDDQKSKNGRSCWL